jgi:CBS domain-containing protein
MKDPTVLQAKRYGIYSCKCQTKLLDAARLMAEEDISALVVTDDEGFLEGIITRTDLLRALTERTDWPDQSVENWMSRQVVTVNPQDHLSQVARILLDRGIHRVVAVEAKNGKTVPLVVISAADLIYHMAKEKELSSYGNR